jgi:peptide deformylase
MDPLALIPREDKRLAAKAASIPDFSDPVLQKFIDDLIACGEENHGVGIAAPQVGKSIRLFIMAPKPGPRYTDVTPMETTAVINPEILRMNGEMEKGWEGCLSVPGYRGLVPRHTEIEVRFLDRHGKSHHAIFTGFLARVFQHEFDHIEGVLYPARMDKDDPLLTLDEYAAATGHPRPES